MKKAQIREMPIIFLIAIIVVAVVFLGLYIGGSNIGERIKILFGMNQSQPIAYEGHEYIRYDLTKNHAAYSLDRASWNELQVPTTKIAEDKFLDKNSVYEDFKNYYYDISSRNESEINIPLNGTLMQGTILGVINPGGYLIESFPMASYLVPQGYGFLANSPLPDTNPADIWVYLSLKPEYSAYGEMYRIGRDFYEVYFRFNVVLNNPSWQWSLDGKEWKMISQGDPENLHGEFDFIRRELYNNGDRKNYEEGKEILLRRVFDTPPTFMINKGGKNILARFEDDKWKWSPGRGVWHDVQESFSSFPDDEAHMFINDEVRSLVIELRKANSLEHGKQIILDSKTETDTSVEEITRGYFILTQNDELYFKKIATFGLENRVPVSHLSELKQISSEVTNKASSWRDAILSQPMPVKYQDENNQQKTIKVCPDKIGNFLVINLAEPTAKNSCQT